MSSQGTEKKESCEKTYLPIEDYGIIGNLHSCSLVGINGSIDFYCYPNFDSPSIFAKLLDTKKVCVYN